MLEEDLKEKAKQLPLLPGVYLMKDDLDNIIYVGKSKALKNRVSSYFGAGKKPKKVMRMVRSIRDFEVRYTDTELEALLLECRLIKTLKPLYNKLLKQDHRYRYIYLNPQEKRPRLKLVREKDERNGVYFGPYERSNTLFEGMQLLNQIFHLPDCKPSEIRENCLSYKRNQCIGPCKEPYDEDEFNRQLEAVMHFLEGEEGNLVREYEVQMQAAAEALDFEKAQELKEQWLLLNNLQFRKEVIKLSKKNQLVVFKLPMPKGGEKLFLMQSYRLLVSAILPHSLRERKSLIKKICAQYEAMDLNLEQCLDKALMDEIYILHGCLKRIDDSEYVVVDLAPGEKMNQENLEQKLMEYIKKV